MKDKEYLLFDLDGTLTDSKPGIIKSIAYGLSRCGLEPPDESILTTFIGPPLWESLERVYGHNKAQVDKVVAEYRKYYADKGIFENSLYGGIENLLKQLAKSRKLILATSKPLKFAETVLSHFKIMDYFTLVCGGELDGTRCKKEEVIAYAIDKAGISDIKKAVMIGDTSYDIIGSAQNGMESIGVLYGYGTKEELIAAGADLIVKSVRELEEVLR